MSGEQSVEEQWLEVIRRGHQLCERYDTGCDVPWLLHQLTVAQEREQALMAALWCWPHDWVVSPIVADVAPNGIHTRDCAKCGLVQRLGPVNAHGWSTTALRAVGAMPSPVANAGASETN